MMDETHKEDAKALMDKAFALLHAGEPKKALEIGRRLEEMCFSGAFEIQALACRDMDEHDEAIRVLQLGTEKVPDVWILWQLLGNCLSDAERYDEALAAYEAGLALPDSDGVSLRFNRATALWRCKRFDEANAIITQLLSDPAFAELESELRLHIHAARIGVLSNLGRHQEAIAHFNDLPDIAEWSNLLVGMAWLEAKYAIALWRAGRSKDAEDVLTRVIRRDKSNSDAQWLKREMWQGDAAVGANAYDLLIHGPWRADAFSGVGPAAGFYTSYRVVADDLGEALAFVREFEPPAIRDELQIDEVQAQEPCAEPKGVYWTSGYSFYEDD